MIENGKLMVSAALFDRPEALRDATVTIALAAESATSRTCAGDGVSPRHTSASISFVLRNATHSAT